MTTEFRPLDDAVTGTRTFRFESADPITLHLTSHDADVTIHHDAPEGGGRVDVHAGDGADLSLIETRSQGGDVHVRVPALFTDGGPAAFSFMIGRRTFSIGRTAHVRIEAHLPEGAALDLMIATGDAQISGRSGDAKIQSSTGDVRLDETGRLRFSSSTGDLDVRRCTDLDAQTSTGDVTVEEASGAVRVRTATGDAQLGTIPGDGDVSSSSGDLTIREVRSAGRLTVRTGTGDVRIGVRRELPVWQDVRSTTGDVTNRLTPRGEPREGQPYLTLDASTGTGDLDLMDA